MSSACNIKFDEKYKWKVNIFKSGEKRIKSIRTIRWKVGGMLEKYKFSSKKKILKSRNKIKGNIGKGKILNEKWIWNGKKKTETQSKERTCV